MRRQSEHAEGTWIESEEPYDGLRRARAIFPDGKARIVRLALTADTFFTIPARDGKGSSGVVCIADNSEKPHYGAVVCYPHKGPLAEAK